jgi:hypothetical protein
MFGFGSKRQKVLGVTVDNIRPILGTLQYNKGIPADFWDNDFVVGFIGFLIGFHAQLASGGALSQTDKGQILLDAFTQLSNLNGHSLGRRFTTLALNETPDFKIGGDNAAMIAFYSIGKLKNESSIKAVIEAKQMAKKMEAADDRGTIAAMLMLILFFKEIDNRWPAAGSADARLS